MKEKLSRVYQLLNILTISGHQNILALGESINIIQNMINEIIESEQKENNIIINNTKNEKKGDKT